MSTLTEFTRHPLLSPRLLLSRRPLAKHGPILAVSLLSLAACASPVPLIDSAEPPFNSAPGVGEEEPPGDSISVEGIDGRWIYLDGTDSAGELSTTVEVTITISDDKIAGAAACNDYGATLRGEPQRLDLSELFSTERACLDSALMDFDERYFAALTVTTTAIATGGSLVLQGDGVNLNFLPSSSLPLG